MSSYENIQPEISRPVETEQDRVVAFQETLDTVGDARVLHLKLDLYQDDPVRDVSQQVKAEGYKSEPSLLVNPKYEELTKGAVSFAPYRTRGGKRSMHGVFFGELRYGEGDDEKTVPVAVKPHTTDSRDSAARDYATNVIVDEIGLHNLESIGVIMSSDAEKTTYSMSLLNPEITTLDSVNWEYMKKHPATAQQVPIIWNQVARRAAMLHSLGSVKHGDLAARNIALHADGDVFPIDWELASLSLKQPLDAEARYNLSRADLGLLLESVVMPLKAPAGSLRSGIDLFKGSTDVWADFKSTIYDEYVQTRLGFVKDKPAQLAEVRDELEELTHSLQAHLQLITKWMS